MGTATVLASLTSERAVNKTLVRWVTHGTIVLSDIAGLTMAGAMAIATAHLLHVQMPLGDHSGLLEGFGVILALFAFCGLYPGVPACSIDEFRLVLRASMIAFPILIIAPLFLRQGPMGSRTIYLLTWLPTILLVPVFRRVTRGFCSRRAWWGIPTVIVGEPEACQLMLKLLDGRRSVGLRPIAVLVQRNVDGTRVLPTSGDIIWGDITDAQAIARENRGCYAVLAMPNSDSAGTKSVFHEHVEHFRNVLIIPDLFGMRSLSVSARDICGVLAIHVDQKLTFLMPQIAKRCFDCAIATFAILIASPLFFLVWTATFLSSPGPVFYGQRRIGKNRHPFTLWKFRSMIVDADAVLQQHLAADPELRAEWERDHKLKNDPRVTWIGRILRKTSLDELPQLWNVIRGDMSLVGPRPIVSSEIERYGLVFRQYQRVTPGLTGLWQISGRNNTTYDVRTKIDDYYVRNWSLSLDIYILLRTIKTIIFSEGAY